MVPAMPPAICAATYRQCLMRRQLAPERKDQRNGRIEMRARDRAENGDEHHQDRPGRQRVAEQRERDVFRQGLRP